MSPLFRSTTNSALSVISCDENAKGMGYGLSIFGARSLRDDE